VNDEKCQGNALPPKTWECRICRGTVQEFFDFGCQPVSNAFLPPERAGSETYYRLSIGSCSRCRMVQQRDEVPRDRMFHSDYPYRSSESQAMARHFERAATRLLGSELAGPDPFAVEIGCNDGIMLGTISRAGVRHLGVDPATGAAATAAAKGVRVRNTFFDAESAAEIRAADGTADVIFSANTVSHIPYLDSVLHGVDELLAPDGALVIEDRYLGDIIENEYFDQIYDEHFYLFSGHSVAHLADRFGFELVGADRLPVHGGSVRYTIARAGAREPDPSVDRLLAWERDRDLTDPRRLAEFAAGVQRIRDDLVALLEELRADGRTVVGYGATSKSATVTNYCGIGP
jgi:methylation protein EvaC